MTTGQFSLITSIGHCGTKWLSTVLHQPDQFVLCHHEMAHLTDRHWWKDRMRRARDVGVGRNAFPKYWETIDPYLTRGAGHLVDSQSWCPIEAAKVAILGNARQIIYLIRNGIQQLHSIANVSTWTHVPDTHWLYGPFLQSYWEIAGRPYKPWGQWSRWERLCLWWATNEFMPKWVRDNFKGRVYVVRLEALLQDIAVLRAMISAYDLDLSVEQLQAYQATDVNRKVHGDRRPETLWKTWSPAQQADFRRICGGGMKAYGYEVPS